MNVVKLAIKRPVFITSIVLVILITGIIAYSRLGVELMPNMSFPAIGVMTSYPGASPEEIEQLISKPLEDELGSISGLKHLSSNNIEGLSVITIEFEMEVDIDKAAQEVRDKVSAVKNNLPTDLNSDPVIEKYNFSTSAIMRIALISDLPPAEMYDLAKDNLKPSLERIKDVGNVQITGGSRREIHVEIDQNKINEYGISMSRIINSLKSKGSNIPIGKNENGLTETVYRSIDDFTSFDQIRNTLVSFNGDIGIFLNVASLGTVKDGYEDERSLGYINYLEQEENNDHFISGVQSCIYLDVIKQSGKNTVSVAESVRKKIAEINEDLSKGNGNSRLIITTDNSVWIKTNVNEAVSSIFIGIVLAILVVYLFLGNIRSTIITAIAIPNSLLGAVIIMYVMGYTFNMMTLMALSLVVGLLVDDAIVVRENIFRKLEDGMDPFSAAEKGTTEVMLAVIATTLAIIAVFFPIGMLNGIDGKLFRQFGFTVIFAMLVSLFDALTVAPFLSAYFAGKGEKTRNIVVTKFEKFQDWMDARYLTVLRFTTEKPILIIIITAIIFISSIVLAGFVKTTYITSGDSGEISVSIQMPPGTSLAGTAETVKKIEEKLKELKDIEYYTVSIGNSTGEVAKANIYCKLLKKRKMTTDENMDNVRGILSEFDRVNISVDKGEGGSSNEKPFVMIVSGRDFKSTEKAAEMIKMQVQSIPDLTDVNTSIRRGSPEYRIYFDPVKMQSLGVSPGSAGSELRYNISGSIAGKFRTEGAQYNILARLKPDQRNLEKLFNITRIENSNGKMVPLNMVARGEKTTGLADIEKRDKAYVIRITANIVPDGSIGQAMKHANDLIEKNVKLPQDVTITYSGDTELFTDTAKSLVFAVTMAIIFIYLVLASLYESFITPFVILLSVPPAITGALLALLVSGFMLDMFSMIGMVMLMGLVTKNSILLVDNAVHGVRSGLTRKQAILEAGQRRLRPIMMTTFAMLAGMLPLALGIGEAAKMKQSMGISIMGGIIVSTMVTLLVVPAVFEYIDRFREVTEGRILVRQKSDK